MQVFNSTQSIQIYKLQSQTVNTLGSLDKVANVKTENRGLTSDSAHISDLGLSADSNWQMIENKYNVNNISQHEAGTMVSSLVDNKLISSTDGLFLMAPTGMRQDPEVKYDLLGSMQKRLDSLSANGSPQSQVKHTESALNILEQLKKLSI